MGEHRTIWASSVRRYPKLGAGLGRHRGLNRTNKPQIMSERLINNSKINRQAPRRRGVRGHYQKAATVVTDQFFLPVRPNLLFNPFLKRRRIQQITKLFPFLLRGVPILRSKNNRPIRLQQLQSYTKNKKRRLPILPPDR